ncbi:MAG: iron (metal) dependent repressor, DtxR family [Thermoleophilia bacterium]|jgi:DtxR family Mn-dependent transcriptional regulator|nr:iron (metal) dependent repressor, DtxR family [Thermoleophilia bacterium]
MAQGSRYQRGDAVSIPGIAPARTRICDHVGVSASHSHTADEYLMTIWLLAYPVGEYVPSRRGPQPTAAARIADQLHVSRASAGEMLKRLEADGMVVRGEKKEAILTEKGRIAAMRIVRRHRMVERLLTDVMGYDGAESHDKADGIDAGFDDEMVERLWEKLGRPERCPHGYPMDAHHELRENPTLKPLGKLDVGVAGTIVRLAEHDGDLLRFFYDAGLTPGVEIEVVAVTGDVVTILRDEDDLVLTGDQARGLYIRREGVPVVPADAACWRRKDAPGVTPIVAAG